MIRKNGLYILLIIMSFLFFIPLVKALNEGEITSISCKSMTGGIVNNNHNVAVNGLDIKVDDVTFEDVSDYLTCEMVIKNNSEDVLSVDLESISKKSDNYITYSLVTEDDNDILQNEDKKYILSIKYQKEYDESKEIDNNIVIALSGDTSSISNPVTNSCNYIVLVLVLLIGSVLIVIYGRKKGIALSIILVILTIIPVVYALTKVTINLENKIIIEKKYGVYYTYETYIPVDTYEEESAKYYKVVSKYESCLETAPDGLSADHIKEVCTRSLENSKETWEGIDYYPVTVTVLENRYKAGDTVTMVDFDRIYYDGTTRKVIGGDSEYSTWRYFSSISGDIDAMSFENEYMIYEKVSSDEIYYVSVGLPQSFTMPDHDVYFKYYSLRRPV